MVAYVGGVTNGVIYNGHLGLLQYSRCAQRLSDSTPTSNVANVALAEFDLNYNSSLLIKFSMSLTLRCVPHKKWHCLKAIISQNIILSIGLSDILLTDS